MITCQLMVALAAEARPLIDHFGLQPERNQRYRTYSRGSMSLVESGIGKLNAAAATASALERNCQAGQKPLCINIGIAGADRPVGELLAAHCVTDETTQQNWHPQLTAVGLKNTMNILTVSSPANHYQTDTAFDMEAAGFFTAATRYSTLEFIHSMKVISDSPQSPLETLDKNQVAALIAAQMPVIAKTIEQLSELQQSMPEHSALNQLVMACTQSMKISATQESTLLRLLQRHQVIEQQLPSLQQLEKHRNIKTLLAALQSSLDRHSGQY